MLQRRAVAAGLGRRVGAHEFRRAMAVRYKRRGGSDGNLMAIAGWRSQTMVSRYVRMESEELARGGVPPPHRRLGPDRRRRRRSTTCRLISSYSVTSAACTAGPAGS